MELSHKDLQLCHELVAIQTDMPDGLEHSFVCGLEDLRNKLARILGDIERCYAELAKRGANIEAIKAQNPTWQQLRDLANGLRKLEVTA